MSPNEQEVEDLLAILKNEVHTKKNKNVDNLHLSSNIVRRLSDSQKIMMWFVATVTVGIFIRIHSQCLLFWRRVSVRIAV